MSEARRPVDAAWTVGLGALALLTVARAFHAPGSYALGHWLLTYRHGFVKRGLVGTLVAPLLTWKSPEEVRFALETLASLSTLAVVVAFTWTCAPWLTADLPRPTRHALIASAAAFATSGWLVFTGHTNGFFDHLLEVAVLAALPLVGTRFRALVPVIAIAAVATHEEFVVYGLPVLVFATWLAAPPGARSVARALAELLVPIALVFGLIAAGLGLTPPPDAVHALRDDVAAYRLFSGQGADNAVYHVTTGLFGNLASADTFASRVARLDLLRAALPTVSLGLALTAAWLWSTPRRGLVALLPVVALAPLALHLVAWDTPRFTLMVVFQTFALWAAAFARGKSPALSPRAADVVTLLAGLVVLNNLVGAVPLMQDDHDGDGVLAPRARPTAQSFQGCASVFKNADFEAAGLSPWSGGDAFELRSGVSSHGGRAVIGSTGRRFLRTGGSDDEVGTLVSPPFELVGDTLLVAVGGGRDPEHLRVSLLVDDAEVAWATGSGSEELVANAWDVQGLTGRQAKVVILDKAAGRWGHLNVDAVCAFRGAAR